MTEAEWLACEDEEPFRLLLSIPTGDRVCARTVPLFCAAYARASVRFLPEVPRALSGSMFCDDLPAAGGAEAGEPLPWCHMSEAGLCLLLRASQTFEAVMYWRQGWAAEAGLAGAAWEGEETFRRRTAAALRRDIFGNPFRPVAFAPQWRTNTVLALALQMYDSRDFSAMPILADALQDAGCDSEDALDHCRGGGPHVRGCWVVDLVLGQE
jgi:hypothetical protein